MLTGLFIAVEAAVILLLLAALLVGQPAAAADNQQRIAAQATQIASYQATLYARPTPTKGRPQL